MRWGWSKDYIVCIELIKLIVWKHSTESFAMFLSSVLKMTLTFCYAWIEDNWQYIYLYLDLWAYFFSTLQVGSQAVGSIVCDDGPCCSTEDCCNNVDAKYSGSMQGNFIPFQFLKLYLMYSATNSTFVAIYFAKDNMEDGVVDNLLSHSTSRMPIYSPSPL